MKKLQIFLMALSVVVIIAGAIVINTEIAWARPAACECVC